MSLPAGSAVLYAELIWGGLFRSTANNISALTNNSVTFTTPQGVFTVAPDPATAQNFNIPVDNITIGFYVRTANVTSLVQAALSGSYAVQGVPALIEALDSRTSETNHAGWTLAVVYENSAYPLRSLTLWSGGTVVSPQAGSTTITVSNFLTPEVLPVSGRIFVSAQEGDAVLTGDQMLFGRTVADLSNLSGPNNPQTNFFASQINNDNGTLDTSGTFGTRNANPAAGTNTSACRQGWDVTSVDVSNQLDVSQSSAVIRFTSSGDLYVPNALALQVDSKGADIEISKAADKTYADIGEEITYTLNLENTGTVSALNVTLNDMLPPETALVAGSVTVDGIPYVGNLPVIIPTIPAGQTVTVVFKASVSALPAVNPVFNIARADYEFFPFAGYSATSFSNSNPAAVFIVVREITNVKSVDKAFAVKGDILTYTSLIRNTGNIPVTNVIFKDDIPAGTTFLNGSVYIDGVNFPSYNPQTGFFAANLTPQASVTVTFQVQIN